MTKSTITRERLEKIKSWSDTYGAGSNVMLPAEEAEELARMALAEIDSLPVAWLAIYHGEVYDEAIGIARSVVEAQADHFGWESALTEIIPLYRHAQQPVTGEPDHQLCKKCNDGLRGGCSACSFSGR
ncbi:TPA: valyl-tRNA synthetase [Klebsiella michiganensis]|nr:valyl-tRNA synthetase [Klebsiella michiganensis]